MSIQRMVDLLSLLLFLHCDKCWFALEGKEAQMCATLWPLNGSSFSFPMNIFFGLSCCLKLNYLSWWEHFSSSWYLTKDVVHEIVILMYLLVMTWFRVFRWYAMHESYQTNFHWKICWNPMTFTLIIRHLNSTFINILGGWQRSFL